MDPGVTAAAGLAQCPWMIWCIRSGVSPVRNCLAMPACHLACYCTASPSVICPSSPHLCDMQSALVIYFLQSRSPESSCKVRERLRRFSEFAWHWLLYFDFPHFSHMLCCKRDHDRPCRKQHRGLDSCAVTVRAVSSKGGLGLNIPVQARPTIRTCIHTEFLYSLRRRLPAREAVIGIAAGSITALDSRAVAALLKELAKTGNGYRAHEFFDYILSLGDQHEAARLCDVFTYTAAISICNNDQQVGDLTCGMRH